MPGNLGELNIENISYEKIIHSSGEEIVKSYLISPSESQSIGREEKFSKGRWSEREHLQFLKGVSKFGTNWSKIGDYVKTRSRSQIKIHAGFYLKFLEKKYIHENSPEKEIGIILNSDLNCLEEVELRIFKILKFWRNQRVIRKGGMKNLGQKMKTKIEEILFSQKQKIVEGLASQIAIPLSTIGSLDTTLNLNLNLNITLTENFGVQNETLNNYLTQQISLLVQQILQNTRVYIGNTNKQGYDC